MSVDGEHGEAMDEEEDRIESLKQQNAKDKSAFTRIKNRLLSRLDEEDYLSRREVKAVCQKLCEVQERTMSTVEELSQKYLCSKEKETKKAHQWNGQIRGGIFGGSWQSSRIMPAWTVLNVLTDNDDDEDEDVQKFLDSLTVSLIRTVHLIIGIIVVLTC